MHDKIQYLLDKLADYQNDNKFQEQRDKLENFFHSVYRGLRSILNEMEGDIIVLRERGLDSKKLKLFNNIKIKLQEMTKEIDPLHPYLQTKNIINWVNDENNFAIIDYLNQYINNFIQKTNISLDFSGFSDLKVDSINNLLNLLVSSEKFMNENPLVNNTDNINLPDTLLSDKNKYEFIPASPDEETKAE